MCLRWHSGRARVFCIYSYATTDGGTEQQGRERKGAVRGQLAVGCLCRQRLRGERWRRRFISERGRLPIRRRGTGGGRGRGKGARGRGRGGRRGRFVVLRLVPVARLPLQLERVRPARLLGPQLGLFNLPLPQQRWYEIRRTEHRISHKSPKKKSPQRCEGGKQKKISDLSYGRFGDAKALRESFAASLPQHALLVRAVLVVLSDV